MKRVTIRRIVCLLCILMVAAVFSGGPAFALSKTGFQKTKVKNVKVTSAGYDTLKVSWARTKGANGYIVYVSNSRLGKYTKAATVKKGSTISAKIGKRVTGKTYYFKVQAYIGSGTAKALNKKSSPKSGKAVPGKTTVILKALSIEPPVQAPTTKIRVQYKKVDGATGYEIYRSTSKTKKFKKIKSVKASSLSVTDKTAAENKAYYYKVRAYRTVSGKMIKGPFSAVKSVTYKRLAGNKKKYNANAIKKTKPNLSGQKAYFLGSSVTRGRGAEGQSFVDQLAVRNGLTGVKQAIDGTTLSTVYSKSYVARVKKLPKKSPDYLVCQLSSNDARLTDKIPLGDIASGYDKSTFDTKSVTGALEYIIAYARDTWGCPVVFYTLPKYSKEKFNPDQYKLMVKRVKEVRDKWQKKNPVYILDLWNDADVNSRLEKNRKLYMADEIHPTKAGYKSLYTPGMAKLLSSIASTGKADAAQNKGVCIDLNEGEDGNIVLGIDGLPEDDTLTP